MLCFLGFFLVVISGTSLKILSKYHCKTFFSCYQCIFTWISTMELLVEMNINAAKKNKKQLTYLFLWNFHLTRWHLWWVEFFNEVNFDWPGCITSCVLVSERWKFHLPSQKQVWKQTSLHPYMVYLSCVISADVWSPTVRKTLYLKPKRLHNGKYLENRMAIIKHCTCKHTGKSQTVFSDRQRESANTFSFQLHFRSRYAAE